MQCILYYKFLQDVGDIIAHLHCRCELNFIQHGSQCICRMMDLILLLFLCNLFRTEHFKEETVEVQMAQEETEGQYSAINCTCMREMYD